MPGEASKREGIAGVETRAAEIYLGGAVQGAWMGARGRWGLCLTHPPVAAARAAAGEAARVAQRAGAGRPADGCHSSRAT